MAVPVEGNARTLFASAKTTNPTAAGAALADSGPLAPGIYSVVVLAGASVAATFKVQHRNAANSADIANEVAIFYASAALSTSVALSFTMQQQGERIQVRPEADITGNAAVSLIVERVL